MPRVWFKRGQVCILAGGHLLADFYGAVLISVTPFLAIALELSLTELGLMATTTSIVTSFLQPAFGHLVDKARVNYLMPVSILIAAIFACLIGFFPNFFAIIFMTLIAGLAVSLYHPIGSQLAAAVSPGREGWSMSIYSLGGSIGLTLAPLIAMPLVEYYGLLSLAVLIIPAVLMAVILMGTDFTRPKLHAEVCAHFATAVQHMHDSSGGVVRLIVRLNIVTGLRSWTHTALAIYVPIMYVLSGHSKVEAAQYLSIYFAAGVIGGIGAGWLSDKVQRRFLVVAASFMSIFFVGGFLLSHGVTALVFWTLAGASLQGIIPVTVVMAQGYLPENTGMASGMMMGFTFGIGSLGALLTGVLADLMGLHTSLMLLVILMVISTILAIFLPEPVKRIA